MSTFADLRVCTAAAPTAAQRQELAQQLRRMGYSTICWETLCDARDLRNHAPTHLSMHAGTVAYKTALTSSRGTGGVQERNNQPLPRNYHCYLGCTEL
eukprot:6214213-Pleurochrysis_carterae.AAC.3